jgi:hypothetical protein
VDDPFRKDSIVPTSRDALIKRRGANEGGVEIEEMEVYKQRSYSREEVRFFI